MADVPPFSALFDFNSAAFDNLAKGTVLSIAKTSVGTQQEPINVRRLYPGS